MAPPRNSVPRAMHRARALRALRRRASARAACLPFGTSARREHRSPPASALLFSLLPVAPPGSRRRCLRAPAPRRVTQCTVGRRSSSFSSRISARKPRSSEPSPPVVSSLATRPTEVPAARQRRGFGWLRAWLWIRAKLRPDLVIFSFRSKFRIEFGPTPNSCFSFRIEPGHKRTCTRSQKYAQKYAQRKHCETPYLAGSLAAVTVGIG